MHSKKQLSVIFKMLNAKFDMNKDYIYSLNTNNIPAKEDGQLKEMMEKIRW